MFRTAAFALAAVVLSPCAAARADEAEDRAVAFVEKLGGTVTRDEAAPGKPVDFVSFALTSVTDADLKPLAAFKGLTTLSLVTTRVKLMFAWAVEEELVPVAVHAALARVKGLKRGKTPARETPRVRPVPDEHVRQVFAVLPSLVRAMTEVQ